MRRLKLARVANARHKKTKKKKKKKKKKFQRCILSGAIITPSSEVRTTTLFVLLTYRILKNTEKSNIVSVPYNIREMSSTGSKSTCKGKRKEVYRQRQRDSSPLQTLEIVFRAHPD
jgi:hypothetical protein